MNNRKTTNNLKAFLSLLLSLLMLTGAFLSFASCAKEASKKSNKSAAKLGMNAGVEDISKKTGKETSKEQTEITEPTDPEPSETDPSDTDPSDTVPERTQDPSESKTPPKKADQNPYIFSDFTMEDDINSCLAFNFGRMVAIKDTAFYVQIGNADNGYASGFSNSEDIFMVKNGKDAKMIASIPVNLIQGYPENTIFYLVPHEEDLFFFVFAGEDTLLMKVETETKNLSTIYTIHDYPGASTPCICDDHLYYFGVELSEPDYTLYPVVYDIDLTTEQVIEERPKFKCAEGADMAFVINVSDGYYYVKIAHNVSPKTEIYRCPIGGGEEELLLETDPLWEVTDIVGNYLFTDEMHMLHVYDKNNGMLIAELSDVEVQNLDLGLRVSPQYVRYVNEEGKLVSYRLDESLEKTVIMEPFDGIPANGYIEYMDGYLAMMFTGQVHKVEKDTHIIAADPLSTEDQYVKKQTDDWIYLESASFIEITDYRGTSEEVFIPDAIDGKPVRFVNLCDTVNAKYPITSLTVPEGVTTISLIDCPSVQQLYLPKTLQNFSCGGFTTTINIADGATIYYAGSSEEWDNIVNMSAVKFAEIYTARPGTQNLKIEFLDQ